MNKERLKIVAQKIRENPEQFQMECWFTEWSYEVHPDNPLPPPIPNCGTAACIAGWTVTLFGNGLNNGFVNPLEADKFCDSQEVNPEDYGKELLELSSDQSTNLFFIAHWPDEFRSKYLATYNPKERAEIAAQRIEHMIETGE